MVKVHSTINIKKCQFIKLFKNKQFAKVQDVQPLKIIEIRNEKSKASARLCCVFEKVPLNRSYEFMSIVDGFL